MYVLIVVFLFYLLLLGGEEFTKIFCVVGRGGIYKDFLFCWEGGFTKMFCVFGRGGIYKDVLCQGGERFFCVLQACDKVKD